MSIQTAAPLVLLAAGGTGGHLFPAEALANALVRRGIAVDLVTDSRATRYGNTFPAGTTHVVPSATVQGRDPVSLIRTFAVLGMGALEAWMLHGRIRPAVVVGFGGYPTLPPVLTATWRRIPTIIHEQNAVMGRANKYLAPRVTAIATSFPDVLDAAPALAAKAIHTGNPVRPAVIEAAKYAFEPPSANGPLKLVVFGGSQGARVMSDIVPAAVALLAPDLRARLQVVQQAREEDAHRVREAYVDSLVSAEVAPFFTDLPSRIAAAHLVIGRAGASTVAELATIGRPGILVPLPHALDQDQKANAGVLEAAGGAIRISQDEFTPARLAAELTMFAAAPARLASMAGAARSVGATDAAERLADLVVKIGHVPQKGIEA